MGVIQLNGQLVAQIFKGAINRLVLFQNIQQTGCTEEILLLQTQFLTFPGVIIRIEYTGNVLCIDGLLGCFQILLLIEQIKIKCCNWFCLPQA